jgi:hypothetical protein
VKAHTGQGPDSPSYLRVSSRPGSSQTNPFTYTSFLFYIFYKASREAQNAEMLIQCLKASISRTVYNKVYLQMDKYAIYRIRLRLNPFKMESATNKERKVRMEFDTDSFDILIDNCCSHTLTNDINDYIEPPVKSSVRVRGNGSTNSTMVGTVK